MCAARIITYPFEVEGNYVLDGLAEITDAYGAKDGVNAVKLETNSNDENNSEVTPVTPWTMKAGRGYDLTFWYKPDRLDGAMSTVLTLYTWNGAAWSLRDSYGGGDELDVWVRKTYLITPADPELVASDGTGLFRFRTSPFGPPPPFPLGIRRWIVDNLKVYGPVISSLLTAALVSDLGDIDGTGDFYTDLGGKVYEEPEQRSKLDRPCVLVVPGGGGVDDPSELTNQTGQAVQSWALTLLVQGTDPHLAMQHLLDDVRLAVGRTTAALNAVSGVLFHGVSEWDDELRVSTDAAVNRAELDCMVSVGYTYDRDTV